MKKLFTTFAALFCMAGAYAQYFPVDTTALNTAFRNLMKNGSAENQQKFLAAFPSTWQEFTMTYQTVPDEKYDKTMSKLAEKHIIDGLGSRMGQIPDSVYCRKLIGLTLGGSWEPDAPSYLGEVVSGAVANNSTAMYKYLAELSENDQFRFWYFYWSSPSVREEDMRKPDDLEYSMQCGYPELGSPMAEAFKVAHGKALPQEGFPHLKNRSRQ